MILEELERQAYITGNRLALTALEFIDSESEKAVSAYIKSLNDEEYGQDDAVEATMYLMNDPEWIKYKGYYVLKGFDENTNIFNHHIQITYQNIGVWKVRIQYNPLGESTETYDVIGNFKQAQKSAIKCALEILKQKGQLKVW